MADLVGCNGVNIIVDLSVESFPNVMRTSIDRQVEAAMTDLDTAYRSHRLGNSRIHGIHGVQVFISMSYNMRLLGTQAELEDQIALRDQADTAQGLAQLSLDTVHRVRGTDHRDIEIPPAEETRRAQLSSVARSLDSLPVVSLDGSEQESQDCPVCHEPFPGSDPNEPDTPVLLRCNHVIGRACIERWVSDHNNSCPMCRAPVFEPGELIDHSQDCPVCHEPFPGTDPNALDTPILLRCNHVIGRACIERWVSDHNNSCPMCRAPVFMPGELIAMVNRHITERVARLEAGGSGPQVPAEGTASVERAVLRNT